MLVLSSSYRAPLTYNDDVVADMERKLDRLRGGLRPSSGSNLAPNVELDQATSETRTAFETAMDDDFNSAGALGGLFDLVRAINAARDRGVAGDSFDVAQATLGELAGVLGLALVEAGGTAGEAVPFVELLVRTRTELRTAKQWALADNLRKELVALGVVLEDTPTGTTWRWER